MTLLQYDRVTKTQYKRSWICVQIWTLIISCSNTSREETSREPPPSRIDYTSFLGDGQANEQVTFWPASTRSPIQEAVVNLQEATLLMCYLDHVFYIQFRCFESFPSSGIRGWLFSHLRQTNWLFNSTIALAKVHQRSLPQTSSHDHLLDFDDADDVGQCYDSALEGLQLALKESHTWTGSIRQTNAVRALMCTSQLMYFEASCTPRVIRDTNNLLIRSLKAVRMTGTYIYGLRLLWCLSLSTNSQVQWLLTPWLPNPPGPWKPLLKIAQRLIFSSPCFYGLISWHAPLPGPIPFYGSIMKHCFMMVESAPQRSWDAIIGCCYSS